MASITIKQRVADGANRLDLERPGWHWDVSLDELDMGSGSACVLGQIYGSYDEGRADLKLMGYDGAHWADECLGFDAGFYQYDNSEREYAALDAAWSREITRRRSGC